MEETKKNDVQKKNWFADLNSRKLSGWTKSHLGNRP